MRMVVVTRWQSNAGAREAKRQLALRKAYHEDRGLAGTIALQYTAGPIGVLIRKEFNGKYYQVGVVAGLYLRYDSVVKSDVMCYGIRYTDEDFEDARRDELDSWRDLNILQEFFTEKTITL